MGDTSSQITGIRDAQPSVLRLSFLVTLADGQSVAFEVNGEDRFFKNQPWQVPTGNTRLRDNLLALSGFKRVVHIPVHEWKVLSGEAGRRAYIESRLRNAPYGVGL